MQRRIALVLGLLAMFAMPVGALADDDDDADAGHPENAILKRGDRYKPRPPGTTEHLRLWFGPYVVPPGHDMNRVDIDLPLRDGFLVSVEPSMRRAEDLREPIHQEAHIHHAHWFALDPGNPEDNYTGGNTEWIFGNGDEETKADFSERSAADPNGPIYGQYISASQPQVMIYMLHNKTNQVLNTYIVLDTVFVHGTKAELAKLGGRPYHDVSGVLFGRTFDVPRNPLGDGEWTTTRDHPKKAIEWTATMDGTLIGTGSHLHPGGLRVLTENMGSKQNPCPDDGRGTGGTLLLRSDALWDHNVPFTEDFQMEVTNPAFRAPIHKGDRIRITGYYENKDHAWYTAMTHQGLYIDKAQPPQGSCTPYLINQPDPGWTVKKVRKKVKVKRARTIRRNGRKVRQVRVKYVWKTVRKRVRNKGVDPTAGVQNRPWPAHSKERYCGTELGGFPCERPEVQRPPGQFTSTVTVANFLYLPGDQSLGGDLGAPPRVKKGQQLTFVNLDMAADIRHSITTCAWPCNGAYVANYPLANGVWDSGTLGYDVIDGGSPNPVSKTPADLPVGKYSYFCRIHPWMRGAFEVVE